MARHARAFSNFGQRVILRDEPVRTGLRSLAVFTVDETTCDAELTVYKRAVPLRSVRLIVMFSRLNRPTNAPYFGAHAHWATSTPIMIICKPPW